MNFKIDENLPVECAELFRSNNYNADTVIDEDLQGCSDSTIYSVCLKEERVLVTLDLDFSDIISYPPNEHYGVIVFRVSDQSKPALLKKIMELLPVIKNKEIRGTIWVVTNNKIRIRHL